MSALEEYVEWESGPIREGTETPEDDLALGIKLARAAIAELEAENDKADRKAAYLKERLLRAEAEHGRLRSQVQGWKDRAANYEDYMERLRVCGTCWWCSTYGDGCNCEENAEELSVSVEHGCSYTPPRWTPYWEEP